MYQKFYVQRLLQFFSIAVFITFSSVAFASDIESMFSVGAGLHLGQRKFDANMATTSLRVLGLSSFRDEIYWSTLEDSNGIFKIERIPPELRKALEDPRLAPRSMVILGYGNDRYEGGGRPTNDGSRAAYTRYALEVSRAYPNIGYLELWNEWNHAIGVKDGSKGTAVDYFKLVATTSSALKNVGSKSKIVVGGLADDLPDWPFARSLVQKGILKYADAFSVHLYNYSAGEKAVPREMFDRLNRLQDILRAGNGGKDFPILVTEMGWPTHEGKLGTSEAQSGAFISQFLLEASTYPWLQGVWIYELFNSGSDKSEREHNFGLLKQDGAAKAGTCAIRETLSLLKNAQFVAKGSSEGKSQWIQFNSGDKSFVVAYSPFRNNDSDISIASGVLAGTKRLCEENPLSISPPTSGAWTSVKVTNTPIVIWTNQGRPANGELLR